MKQILTIVIATLFISLSAAPSVKPIPCGTWQGHNIYKGEKGGCYYLKTKKKVKVYIDKKHCKC